jgi:hypothetical protein
MPSEFSRSAKLLKGALVVFSWCSPAVTALTRALSRPRQGGAASRN